jgi:hypothetical protein
LSTERKIMLDVDAEARRRLAEAARVIEAWRQHYSHILTRAGQGSAEGSAGRSVYPWGESAGAS